MRFEAQMLEDNNKVYRSTSQFIWIIPLGSFAMPRPIIRVFLSSTFSASHQSVNRSRHPLARRSPRFLPRVRRKLPARAALLLRKLGEAPEETVELHCWGLVARASRSDQIRCQTSVSKIFTLLTLSRAGMITESSIMSSIPFCAN